MTKEFLPWAQRAARSNAFFKIILALFGLESLYIACSAAYPMVFDENTMFGLIQIYAHRLDPIFWQQPAHAAFAGPLAREPSYLYQYLLSFPYRLTVHLTSGHMLQIIVLRCISIVLFGIGLVLFRRLLLRIGVSGGVANLSLLVFILIPVVPLLAGQINYDNLVMPAVALTLLLTVMIAERVRLKGQLSIGLLASWLITCCLGSLVQFEFLPVFVATALWLVWLLWRRSRSHGLALKKNYSWWRQHNSWLTRTITIIGLVVALGLFAEMYGVNVVRYHNPTPSCGQVLPADVCAGYGSWERDQQALAHKQAVSHNPITYGAGWLYRMAVGVFYTSSGGASPQAYYLSVNPLPMTFYVALACFVIGLGCFARYGLRLLKTFPFLWLLLGTAVFYLLLLFLRNYLDYVHIGQKIAINGRYALPVLLPIITALLLALQEVLRPVGRIIFYVGVLVVIVLATQGGGVTTYLVVSNTPWYWPNRAVVATNHALQKIVKPIVLLKRPVGKLGN